VVTSNEGEVTKIVDYQSGGEDENTPQRGERGTSSLSRSLGGASDSDYAITKKDVSLDRDVPVV